MARSQLATTRARTYRNMRRIRKADDGSVLIKDKTTYVRFEQQLAKAGNEGRIDGDFKCLVCGMRYLHQNEAENCCRISDA